MGNIQGDPMSKNMLLGAAVFAALGLFMSGCTQDCADEQSSYDKSAVLVHVNDNGVTLDKYKEEAAALPPASQQLLDDPEARAKFLDNLVARELIIQEAVKTGLGKDPEVMKRLDQTRDNLLIGLYVKNEVFDKSKFSDEDVKKYFDEHKDSLGSVRISHIQVPAKETAEEVLAKYKAGEPFAKLAKEYSGDEETKAKGGDLGFLSWAQIGSGDLKDAAFNTPAGDVSNVVRSSFAFHVIKVTEKKPATDKDFDSLKDPLKEYLTEKRKEELFEAKVKDLKTKAAIKPDEEAQKQIPSAATVPQGQPSE